MGRYAAELEALYSALEERQQERLRAMRAGGDATVPERVRQALEVGFSYPCQMCENPICLRYHRILPPQR